jgi:hypothetical protein
MLQPSLRKRTVIIYVFRACQVLNKNLPAYLKDPPKNMLDEEGKKSYNNLIKNLNDTLPLR